ncbi:LytR/AlgR family response regulator transcription factor [Pedobacter endophyticus]|uniref:Response regulator transcription factor n=1 Tax=Pedobacter endophyticus TaxID=2789740 RepID=A0A7S9Q0X7_9SPHI|nr:LytTR family DNA-binding domain-containing protein [Pedobacter endophyticus]QPH41241.1 response regulator transcription factor [Pedobacter endophyticus]
MTFSCIVVDDDLFAVEQLEEYIFKLPGLNLDHSYTNPLMALKEIEALEEPIDFLFCDIQMPNLSGLELAKLVHNKVKNLILVSAYPEYAVDGYGVDAKDFLSKPFDFPQFEHLVARVNKRIKDENPFIVVKLSKNSFVNVNVNEIVAIEGNGNYINIHTINDFIVPYYKLSAIENDLKHDTRFKRASKSFIVSTDHIKRRSGNLLTLKKGIIVNISIPFRKDFEMHH